MSWLWKRGREKGEREERDCMWIYTAFTLPLGAVPVASWSRLWSDIGSVYTAPWSKGANAIIEVETSCLMIMCCNMAILPIWSLVPELACLSASSPPSSFQSSLTWRKPPSSFKSSLTVSVSESE